MPNFQRPDSKVINDMINTPFMTFKSRWLIKAALAAGNATGEVRRSKIEEFAKKLAEYSWPHTRDYTLACIMLMVVYVASLMNYDYDLVEAKQRNDKGEKQSQDQSIKLSDYITQKINRNKIKDLFNSIINIEKTNDSQSIANNITHNDNDKGWFKKIFIKLISLYENNESKQQEIFRKFVRQVKCMKPWWRYNKKYMQSLTDAIEHVLRVNLNIEHQPEPEPESGSESESGFESESESSVDAGEIDDLAKKVFELYNYYDRHPNLAQSYMKWIEFASYVEYVIRPVNEKTLKEKMRLDSGFKSAMQGYVGSLYPKMKTASSPLTTDQKRMKDGMKKDLSKDLKITLGDNFFECREPTTWRDIDINASDTSDATMTPLVEKVFGADAKARTSFGQYTYEEAKKKGLSPEIPLTQYIFGVEPINGNFSYRLKNLDRYAGGISPARRLLARALKYVSKVMDEKPGNKYVLDLVDDLRSKPFALSRMCDAELNDFIIKIGRAIDDYYLNIEGIGGKKLSDPEGKYADDFVRRLITSHRRRLLDAACAKCMERLSKEDQSGLSAQEIRNAYFKLLAPVFKLEEECGGRDASHKVTGVPEVVLKTVFTEKLNDLYGRVEEDYLSLDDERKSERGLLVADITGKINLTYNEVLQIFENKTFLKYAKNEKYTFKDFDKRFGEFMKLPADKKREDSKEYDDLLAWKNGEKGKERLTLGDVRDCIVDVLIQNYESVKDVTETVNGKQQTKTVIVYPKCYPHELALDDSFGFSHIIFPLYLHCTGTLKFN